MGRLKIHAGPPRFLQHVKPASRSQADWFASHLKPFYYVLVFWQASTQQTKQPLIGCQTPAQVAYAKIPTDPVDAPQASEGCEEADKSAFQDFA